MANIETKLESARKELLDLTLRNKLLNHRLLKSKGIQVKDELPSEVFRLLVLESRAMTFLPTPEEDDKESLLQDDEAPAEEAEEPSLDLPKEDADDEETVADRHLDTQLQTSHTPAELQKRLLRTYYDARTYIQEQGVNILYLALGMLEWYEAPNSETKRLAPLILIPAELDRASARARFRLRYTNDELVDNLSLRAKLKHEFDLALPELPTEPEDLEVNAYFDAVAEAMGRQERWSVDRTAIALAFFSYGTFLMYNDLDQNNWPENNKPVNQHLIQALLGDKGFQEPPPVIGEEERVDDYLSPHDSSQVVDADSSQTRAILDINAGRNLIIQGPPGTGKSQTITNIIAEALDQDKTVLFVAEKMAALEVVKRRLDGVGLGDACLELHSQKTRKKVVLTELQRTLKLGQPKMQAENYNEKILLETRNRLNDYCDAVNTPILNSDATPYDAFGRLSQLRNEFQGISLPNLDDEMMDSWSGTDFRQRLEQVGELERLIRRIGIPQQHPFWGSQVHHFLPSDISRLKQHVNRAGTAVVQLRKTAQALANHLQLEEPISQSETTDLITLTERLLKAPDLTNIAIRNEAWLNEVDPLKSALETGSRLTQIHETYDKWLIPEAWEQDVLEIRQDLAVYSSKWWRLLSGTYRRAKNRLQGLCRDELPKKPKSQLKLVDAVLEAQRLQSTLKEYENLLQSLYGPHWQGHNSNWPYLIDVAEWLVYLYRDVEAEHVPSTIFTYLAQQPDCERLKPLLSDVEKAIENHTNIVNSINELLEFDNTRRFGEEESLLTQPFTEQLKLFGNWYRHANSLQDMVAYNQQIDRLSEQGMADLIPITASWPQASQHLTELLEKTWYERLTRYALSKRPSLGKFDPDIHEQRIERFRELDEQVLQLNKVHLAYKHWERLPNHQAGGQLGILKREFEKKRRHLPIRKLIQKAGNAIQAIKPVFMMSPLSIAMFLPPDSITFDLVVFDEASQVKPVDAFGALLRGQQAVVVGDRKQLPPTSFFDQILEEIEEENVTTDLESILSLFLAQSAPERMLRWHYRSQHESLIAVSNHEFYDNKLVIFPSPDGDKEELGVFFHHLPDAVYDRGKSRTNRKEAQEVAQAAMEHARTRPELSLGVAAFSTSQMQAIQLQLEHLRQQDPSCESFFNRHPEEPFFVKNLENVQGDERDVIFISVGYGRDATGKLSMNFGPLNQEGGERRLNVLITRARRRCEVFSSLTADDIDLNRTQAPGVKAFKTYLKFAEHGEMQTAAPTGRGPDSPFEAAVANALQRQGYYVVHQVGAAGFYIDLAIVDEKRPGRYVLGIECDGATYHSARAARDRDRLRQQVLEDNLNWQIHRIWSTDWFRNPDRELRRTVEAIEAAKAATPTEKPSASSSSHFENPIKRQKDSFSATSTPTEPYELAKLNVHHRIKHTYELHEVPRSKLVKWIEQILATEAPVHIDEVMRRIGDAYGVSRLGRRIRASIKDATIYAVQSGVVQKRGDFLWEKGVKSPEIIRDRADLPNTSRKLDLIAPEEIVLAVETIVKNAFGMQRDDIPSAVCNAFGFGRTSVDMKQQVEITIDEMIDEGRLTKQGDFLVVTI